MSDLTLIAVVALLTYLSRAGAMVLLPAARGPLLRFVSRVPAPLFAGLAVFALFGAELRVPEPSSLAAVIAALAVSPRRSLGLTLAAGIAGYLLFELLL